MPKLKINEKPYYNSDQIANSIEPDDIANIHMEAIPGEGLCVRRRPGLPVFTDLNTAAPGDGIFEWEATGLVIAVSNGRVFKVNEDGSFVDITTHELKKRVPVIFADGSALDGTPWLYMANGALVHSINGANTVQPSGEGAPIDASHVAYINLRFIANKTLTNRWLFTDTDPATGAIEPDFWNSSDNPNTCEARGDNLLAMNDFLQEIYCWGGDSLEIWQDDGATPFSPIPQATSQAGLEAVYSVAQAANAMFALCLIDDVRCVIKLEARTPQVVSEPISNVLAGYDRVDDAIGQLVSVGGMHIYLLQFPSAGKTWAYDVKNDTWIPWGTWDEVRGEQRQFLGQHTAYVRAWNKHLMMSRVDGKIFMLDRAAYEDDGLPVKSYRRTIWEDHGNGARKRADRLRIKIKAGQTLTGNAYLRWQDDGIEEWSPYMEITLNPLGKRDFIADLSRLGMYESRRYEISITDDADLVVVWADETLTQLRF
jgi:hypothetical protein